MSANDFHLSWTLFWQVFILFTWGMLWIGALKK